MTGVEFLLHQIIGMRWLGLTIEEKQIVYEKAKAIENKERLKNQLFIGKVSDIVGEDTTIQLLKECNEAFKPKEYEKNNTK